jgi:hypothetical protein
MLDAAVIFTEVWKDHRRSGEQSDCTQRKSGIVNNAFGNNR